MRGRFWVEEDQVDGFVRDVEFVRDFGGENGVVEFELDGVGLLFATPRDRIAVSFGDRARRGGFGRVSWLVLDALTVDTVRRLLTRRRQSRRPWYLHAFVYAFVLFLSSEPVFSTSPRPFPPNNHRSSKPAPLLRHISFRSRTPTASRGDDKLSRQSQSPFPRTALSSIFSTDTDSRSRWRILIACLIRTLKNPVASLCPEHVRSREDCGVVVVFFVVVVSSTDE